VVGEALGYSETSACDCRCYDRPRPRRVGLVLVLMACVLVPAAALTVRRSFLMPVY
jgi:hypothetical protein